MSARRTSVVGTALIQQFEGFSPVIYTCPAGYPTIGYGHRMDGYDADNLVQPLSGETALQLLFADLSWVEEELNDIPTPLTQPQFDALVSLVYNIGASAFAKSTLRRYLVARDFTAAAREFGRWIHGGGKVLPGLVARRAAERQLFESGD